jgi:hypothetical protein
MKGYVNNEVGLSAPKSQISNFIARLKKGEKKNSFFRAASATHSYP